MSVISFKSFMIVVLIRIFGLATSTPLLYAEDNVSLPIPAAIKGAAGAKTKSHSKPGGAIVSVNPDGKIVSITAPATTAASAKNTGEDYISKYQACIKKQKCADKMQTSETDGLACYASCAWTSL